MKLYNHLDFNKLEARNMISQVLSVAPTGPSIGQSYFDSVALIELSWNGTAWTNKATDSLLLNGNNAAFYLARANHTGSQLSATISDLSATVSAYKLSQFAAPIADVAMGGFKLTGLADPINPQDAATMNYVTSQLQQTAAGIDSKPSARIASTANLGLTTLAAIDGVTPVAGDRVLVKNQTTASQNGVYVAAAGAWTRAADADQNNELTPGAFWFVEEGTVNAKTQWRIENTGAIVVGTTGVTINQFGAAAGYSQGNGILFTGSVISVQPLASGGITVAAGGVSVDTTIVARKYSITIGDGASTTITVTHNLGTLDVVTSIRDAASGAIVMADVVNATVNTVTITFATAPAANAFRATVIG